MRDVGFSILQILFYLGLKIANKVETTSSYVTDVGTEDSKG